MIKEYLDKLPLSQAAQDARDSMRIEISALRDVFDEEISRQEAMLQNITRALNRQLEMLE